MTNMKFRGLYWFLSNMYPCDVKWKGNIYKSVESVYQMEKCINDEDKEMFRTLNGFESKKLGRKVTLRNDWNIVKIDIMKRILTSKFENKKLYDKLSSIEEEIIEDNDWKDKFWGRYKGIGKNILGKLLMEIRDDKDD